MSAMPYPQSSGPPYPPQNAMLGGEPSTTVDDPICAVLILLFFLAALTNGTVLRLNRKQEPHFLLGLLLLIFCFARIVALTMRLVWASYLTNVNVAIAANVFTMAGVLLLYVVNILFTRRLLRGYARYGHHAALDWVLRFLVFCIVAMLVMVVTVTVDSFFTLDANVHRICRDVQLFAITYIAVLAFTPIPVMVLTLLLGGFERTRRDSGFWLRFLVLMFTATLLTCGAAFRCGVAYAVVPLGQTAWYLHKACYYCFNFVIEITVVSSYAISRFDPHFRAPTRGAAAADKEATAGGVSRRRHYRFIGSINTESEVFGPGSSVEAQVEDGHQAA